MRSAVLSLTLIALPLVAGQPLVYQEGTTRLAGYAFALGAGAIWGTTGPLSTPGWSLSNSV